MDSEPEQNAFTSPEYEDALFQDSPIGIAYVSREGTWFKVNTKMEELFGFTPLEFGQLTWEHVTRYEDIAPDRDQVRRCLAGEIDGYTLEKVYRRKDGSTFWAWITVKVLRNPKGEFEHFVSYVIPVRRRFRDLRLASISLKQWKPIASAILFTIGVVGWAFGLIKWTDLVNLLKSF